MMARTACAAHLLICAALLSGCDNRASQCDKLALSIRGVVKKEMTASAALPEATSQDKEIARALKRAAVAMDREFDDWQLKRPDKNTSDKGAQTIKNFADGVRAIEVGDETLKAFLRSYANAVQELFEFSKQRVEANSHEKSHEIQAKIDTEKEKLIIWCTK